MQTSRPVAGSFPLLDVFNKIVGMFMQAAEIPDFQFSYTILRKLCA